MEWSNSLLRHFKIQTLLKINCCMTAISAFRVTQHSQTSSLFFRNRIQCIALYQLHNSQALLNLRRISTLRFMGMIYFFISHGYKFSLDFSPLSVFCSSTERSQLYGALVLQRRQETMCHTYNLL